MTARNGGNSSDVVMSHWLADHSDECEGVYTKHTDLIVSERSLTGLAV